jgi:hypothetical protein
VVLRWSNIERLILKNRVFLYGKRKENGKTDGNGKQKQEPGENKNGGGKGSILKKLIFKKIVFFKKWNGRKTGKQTVKEAITGTGAGKGTGVGTGTVLDPSNAGYPPLGVHEIERGIKHVSVNLKPNKKQKIRKLLIFLQISKQKN